MRKLFKDDLTGLSLYDAIDGRQSEKEPFYVCAKCVSYIADTQKEHFCEVTGLVIISPKTETCSRFLSTDED